MDAANKMMMETAIVHWPSRSFQIEVIIAKQHRKMNEKTFLLSLPQKWIETNDLRSTDDENVKYSWLYLMTLMIFNSLQGVLVWSTVIFAPITDTSG